MKKVKKLQLGKITIQNLNALIETEMDKVKAGDDSNLIPVGTTNLPIFC